MSKPPYIIQVCGGLLLATSLIGCQRQASSPSAAQSSKAMPSNAQASTPAPQTTPKSFRANPDFGGVKTQHVEVTATGPTLEGAVDNAIRLGIEQVNGKEVDAGTVQLEAGLSAGNDGQRVDVSSTAYANSVASATSGAVTHFQLLSQKQVNRPTSTDEQALKASQGASWDKGKVDASANVDASAGNASASASETAKASWDQQQGASQIDYQGKHTEYATEWEVRIAADVATYREAAGAKLTRVVVASPQVTEQTFRVGDSSIPAVSVVTEIQSKISQALIQTHRFTVLDRNADPQMSQEIGLIQSGNATPADAARLGQRLATDLIVIPVVDRFEYLRHEHQLRMTDRSLVSYSGGSEISFRVVNAVTGQMVMSQSFKYSFPSTAPTTLGVSVDGVKLASDMMDAMDRSIVSAILQSTYPLSVLQLQGHNVIINQGGDAVQQGATYQAVTLGKAIIDPQSGQSLGPTETPCCSVQIDRVTPNLSYGHIVEPTFHLDAPFAPGSMELRGLVEVASPFGGGDASAVPTHKAKPHNPAPAPAKKADDANW